MASIVSRFNYINIDYISGNSWSNDPLTLGVPDAEVSQYLDVDTRYNNDILWVNPIPLSEIPPVTTELEMKAPILYDDEEPPGSIEIDLIFTGESDVQRSDKMITLHSNDYIELPGSSDSYRIQIQNWLPVAAIFNKSSLDLVSSGPIVLVGSDSANYTTARIRQLSPGNFLIIPESPIEDTILHPFFLYLQ